MTSSEKIIKFNEIKKEFGSKVFTHAEIAEVLKEKGFRNLSTLVQGLVKCKIIIPASNSKKGGSVFSSIGTPVYIKTLERAIEIADTLRHGYQKAYYNKQKITESIDPIAEAVKLLKENGYKIYKPTTRFEEI